MQQLARWIKHRWLDASDSQRAVPDDLAQRLARRIAASEVRHSGEIRICVEAALPLSYLWRIGADKTAREVVRERALTWFERMGIWDTENNNGVLIYLLLAERSIEFVADRGLTRRVPAAQWQAAVDRLGKQLHSGAFESGLTQALEEVSALLVAHFPVDGAAANPDELSNAVVRA